jgi:hypothetical protein
VALHPEALLVDRAVVAATEQGEVVERGRAAVGPVAQMMALAEAKPAAREAAAPVAVEQSPPQRGGNGAGPAADLEHLLVGVVPHHHPAGVARQALGRSRGNVPVLQHRLHATRLRPELPPGCGSLGAA